MKMFFCKAPSPPRVLVSLGCVFFPPPLVVIPLEKGSVHQTVPSTLMPLSLSGNFKCYCNKITLMHSLKRYTLIINHFPELKIAGCIGRTQVRISSILRLVISITKQDMCPQTHIHWWVSCWCYTVRKYESINNNIRSWNICIDIYSATLSLLADDIWFLSFVP